MDGLEERKFRILGLGRGGSCGIAARSTRLIVGKESGIKGAGRVGSCVCNLKELKELDLCFG